MLRSNSSMSALPSIDPDARCRECRHPLTGLAVAKCPECGAEFDPADARTFRLPFFRSDGWARRHRAPGLLFSLVAVGCSVAMLIAASVTVGIPQGSLAVILSSLFVALVWLVRFVLALAAHREAIGDGMRVRFPRAWVVLPLCGVLTVAACMTGVPRRVRWLVARPALESQARLLLADPRPDARIRAPEGLGTLAISSIYKQNGRAVFCMPKYGILSTPALVYSPPGVESRRFGNTYSWLGDRWDIEWIDF